MKDFRPPQLGHTLMLFLAIIIIAILMFIVSSADAQESTEEPPIEWACAYEHWVGYSVRFVAGITLDGQLIQVITAGTCTYVVDFGGYQVQMTLDDLLDAVVRPPWCTQSLIGTHEMGQHYGQLEITVTDVNFIMEIQECWLRTDQDTGLTIEQFIHYRADERNIHSYPVIRMVPYDGYNIHRNSFGVLNQAVEPGFGTVVITSEATFACFNPTGCPGIQDKLEIMEFSAIEVGNAVTRYAIPTWVLEDYIRDTFPNVVFVYPEQP